MATVIETRIDPVTGHELAVYESGAVYDRTAKKATVTPESTRITPETSRQFRQQRLEKQARLLRERIGRSAETAGLPPKSGPAHVMAAAAGQMLDQIVLNPAANPRYRAETWQMIGRAAGLLGDGRETAQVDGVQITLGADIAAQIIEKIAEMRAKKE